MVWHPRVTLIRSISPTTKKDVMSDENVNIEIWGCVQVLSNIWNRSCWVENINCFYCLYLNILCSLAIKKKKRLCVIHIFSSRIHFCLSNIRCLGRKLSWKWIVHMQVFQDFFFFWKKKTENSMCCTCWSCKISFAIDSR